jgi:hypothetical protein
MVHALAVRRDRAVRRGCQGETVAVLVHASSIPSQGSGAHFKSSP